MGKKNKFSINGSAIPLSINDEGEVALQSVELGDDYSSADLTSRCGHEPDPRGNRHLRQVGSDFDTNSTAKQETVSRTMPAPF